MKKTHQLESLSKNEGGEYVLGLKDLGTHACYLIYGELEPGERGREVCPGDGHEEILLAVKGDLHLAGGGDEFMVRQGEAVHLVGVEKYEMDNPGVDKAVYVMAGGHSAGGHGH